MVAAIREPMLRGWRWLSVGAAIGLPVAAAVVLVPLRGHADPAHVALVLTVVVVAVAARGRRFEALLGAGAAAVAFVVIAAAQELRDLLGLDDLRFERGPRRHQPPAEVARTGEVHIALDQVALQMTGPPTEIALPVTCGLHEWGRFVLSPLACMSAPLELRLVAVVIADQVGAALAEAASHAP